MTEAQVRRFDPIAWFILTVIATIAIYGGVGTYVSQKADHRQDQQRIADQGENAVTNCQNGNQSRHASWALWNYVLTLTEASNPHETATEAAFVQEFRRYVGKVYQPHDCSRLDLKYPLPSPPVVPVP